MKKEMKKTFSYEDIQEIVKKKIGVITSLRFKASGCWYEILIEEKDTAFLLVHHQGTIDQVFCSYCEGEKEICTELSKEAQKIFQHIASQPQMRLRLLFD